MQVKSNISKRIKSWDAAIAITMHSFIISIRIMMQEQPCKKTQFTKAFQAISRQGIGVLKIARE